MGGKLNMKWKQGESFTRDFRWEVEPFIYRPITGVSNSAPCLITCPAHGLLPDQQFSIQGIKGPTVLNESVPEKATDWRRATVVDPDTIELNRINSSDFPVYVSGGYIRYRTVVDLTGYSARMEIRDKYTKEVLYTLSTTLGNLIIDPVLQYVGFRIVEADAVLFTWKKGEFDLELVSPDPIPIVTSLLSGDIYMLRERTTLI